MAILNRKIMKKYRNSITTFEIEVTYAVCWATKEAKTMVVIFDVDTIQLNHCVTYMTHTVSTIIFLSSSDIGNIALCSFI